MALCPALQLNRLLQQQSLHTQACLSEIESQHDLVLRPGLSSHEHPFGQL